jgi:hypothetical protein
MRSVIDEENLIKSIEKIKLLKKQEDINFEKIKENFRKINYCYDTSNTEYINAINEDLIGKLSVISRIHNNTIIILNKNLEKYRNTKVVVEKMFEKLD